MSLLYWLPLMNDAHNQGLNGDTTTIMGSGITYTPGKLGNAATFPNNSNSCLNLPGLQLQTGSWCAWIKCNGEGAGAYQYVISEGRDTGSIGTNFWMAKAGTTLYARSHKVNITYTNFPLNVWTHICMTFGNNKLSLYINGQFISEIAYTDNTDYAQSNNRFVIGKMAYTYTNTSNYFPFNGQINDVRVYDHCLSIKEIKEIAKGLVLHYKMDDTYIGTITNLYSGNFSNTCYNGATGKYNYGTTTDMYKTTGFFQNRDCVKVYMGTDGLDAYPYVYFDAFATTGTNIQTLSFDYYPTIQTSIIPYSYNGTYNFSYNANGMTGSATNVNSITVPVFINQWNHIELTMQKYDTTNTSRGNGYIRLGSAKHTSSTDNYWLFSNIQVENGEHATGYVPPGTTRNNTMIYDCSGYNNDGIIVNTLSTSSNTAKYSNSFIFSNSSYIKCTPFYFNTDKWTYSFWYYKTVQPSAYEGFICLSKGNGSDANKKFAAMPNANRIWFKCESGSGNLNSLYTNQWVHIVETSDGKIYENGIYKTSMTPGTVMTDCNDLVIGARAASAGVNSVTTLYNGQISDVRIYATVLSDEDILDLYHTPFSIDNKGNSYAREVIEDTNLNITKTGQFHGNEMLDDDTFTTASITKTDKQLKVNTLYEY